MQQTSDGGYILFGRTNSSGEGAFDFWLVKTDAEGNKTWDNSFGGELNDVGAALALAHDGGYILSGSTESFGSGEPDAYLVKTDEYGNEEWSQTYGSDGSDAITGVIQTTGGDIMMIGTTDGNENKDVLVIKTDSAGNEIWTRTFGEELTDIGRAICETSDSNFVLTGGTRNYGAEGMDVLLMKIDNAGIIVEDTTTVPDDSVIISESRIVKASEDIVLSNFPNPFSSETTIRVTLKLQGRYKLRIVDLSGREIIVLFDNFLDEGKHAVTWNSMSRDGRPVNPGIYLLELTGDYGRKTIK
ncbi:MAG: T9SS type A sorting domain-containing protein [Bacteroidales bacterium]